MKKLLAIFFISVIGIHFISCTVYASSYFHVNSSEIHGVSYIHTAEFMQFEVIDGFEELGDNFGSDFSDFFTFSTSSVYFFKNKSLFANQPNQHNTTNPIYIFNHVLLI